MIEICLAKEREAKPHPQAKESDRHREETCGYQGGRASLVTQW